VRTSPVVIAALLNVATAIPEPSKMAATTKLWLTDAQKDRQAAIFD
jgi:hypothetical protein